MPCRDAKAPWQPLAQLGVPRQDTVALHSSPENLRHTMTRLFWTNLEAAGERPALVSKDAVLSYRELAHRAGSWAEETHAQLPHGVERPLVLLEATNTIASVVAYVGCLRARWPVVLVGPGQASGDSQIAQTYRPNVRVLCGHEDFCGHAASNTCVDSPQPLLLHPDLCVLLSTSGTTGAAKLVRLSAANLQSNAVSIATYLAVSETDKAITALPYHYSYGMSVLHSYLLSCASIVLTDTSLADDEFWELASSRGVTSLALVPTQFELLERQPPLNRRLPALRYVTQAGGKLHPRLARAFAERASEQSWKLFLMYGQTEASPRMAYLPAEDASVWYESIGKAIPGGTLWLEDESGRTVSEYQVRGELVYEGPNVMMGYALKREHLSEAQGPQVLRTGDIAERLPNGYFRIVGRANRFIKLFGLRVSLDELETQLWAAGHQALATGSDDALVLFVQPPSNPAAVAKEVAQRFGWPERVVRAERLEEPPCLASGKVDSRALSRLAAELPPRAEAAESTLEAQLRSALRCESLAMGKSFLQHGGDSLAYLEVQLWLSKRLGQAPEGWERWPLRELHKLDQTPHDASNAATKWQPLSADLLARVTATSAVVALHSTEWKVGGGAIFLLVLVGYSLARFQREALLSGQVLKVLRAMGSQLVGLYYIFVGLAALRFSPFDSDWFLLTENFAEQPAPDFLLPYWFVSTYVQVLLLAVLPFAWKPVRKLAQRAPLALGLATLAATGLLIELTEVGALSHSVRHRHPMVAFQLLAAGWCIFVAGASTPTQYSDAPEALYAARRQAVVNPHKALQQLVVACAVVLVWLQNYGLVEWSIAAFLLGGSLSTLSGLRLRVPQWLARLLFAFGSLSLHVYLAHVPALYFISEYIEPGALSFAATLGLSVVLALALKHGSHLAVSWRFQRLETARDPT